MVRKIMLKDIQEQILSFKSLITLVVILVLFVVNGFISGMNYRERQVEYEKVKNETSNNLKACSIAFTELVHAQQKHIKPPSKLSFVSHAEERNLPNAVLFDGFKMQIPGYIKKQNTLFSTFGTIDWTNILLIFMSFICIGFAYNAFSGEKVNGILRLVLSNRVNRWQIIMGKWLGILAIVMIPLVLGFIINLLIITLTGIDM